MEYLIKIIYKIQKLRIISNGSTVSLDYLVDDEDLKVLDKKTLQRLEDIEKLDEATKQHLFFLIDNVIQNYKTKKAFNK